MQNLPKEIISTLLIDHTTEKNIIWATGDYSEFGIDEKSQVKLEQIYGENATIKLVPRCQKQKSEQANRTRNKAEVFTPSWLCNDMNNMVDEAWFEHENIFNCVDAESYATSLQLIIKN